MEIIRHNITEKELDKYLDQELYTANKIEPIGFTIKGDTILFLFKAEETINETSMFLSLSIKPDHIADMIYTANQKLYDLSLGLNAAKATDLADTRVVYITDFFGSIDDNYNSYFYFYAIEVENHNPKVIKKVLLPKIEFIKLQSFLISFTNRKATIEYLTGSVLNNATFVTVRNIKLDASAKIDDKTIVSHYTLTSGPFTFPLNFFSNADPECSRLKEPLTSDLYDAFYQEDPTPVNNVYIPNDEKLYIIYMHRSNIRTEDNKVRIKPYILILDKTLIDKTNFLNPYKIYNY